MQVNRFEDKYRSGFQYVKSEKEKYSVPKKEDEKVISDAVIVTITSSQGQQPVQQEMQSEPVFSLTAWVKDIFAIGKKTLQSLWFGEEKAKEDILKQEKNTEEDKEETFAKAEENLAEQDGDIDANVAELLELGNVLSHTQVAVAATAMTPEQKMQDNPQISPVEIVGRQKQSLWEKIKVKFQEIMGYLTKQFSGGSAFEAKQEQAKENLPRRRHYPGVDLEVTGDVKEDNHLMDSYNKKGEYHKLSVRK